MIVILFFGASCAFKRADGRAAKTLHPRAKKISKTWRSAGCVLAAAVEASVFGAGATGPLHLAAQRFTGAVNPYRRILRADPRMPGQIVELTLVEIHDAEGVAVLGLKGRKQPGDALADLVPHLRIRHLSVGELLFPGIGRPLGTAAPPVVIDDGIAQDPVKPCHDFLVGHSCSLFDSPDKCGLQNIFRNGPRLYAAL